MTDMSSYQWIESNVPKGLEIRQVYGFIFALDGLLLLLEDEGVYTLPGGKPENDESVEETLVRETQEEAQAQIGSMEYLGYQCVEGEEHFAQVRFVALLDQLFPSAPDPSTGKQYRRMWVRPFEANALLNWGQSGDQQVSSAVAAAVKMGVSSNGEASELPTESEIPIQGGRLNRGKLVRLGDYVLRPADEDPAIEQLIIEVGKVFSGIPATFGRDTKGRLKLEWIEGESAEIFDEDEERSRARLLSVGALLRELHDSTASIATGKAATSRDSLDPSGVHEVICHGDAGPGNIVFRDGRAFALIDWEMAAPGRRSWDLATALRYWAPFRNPANKKPAELLLNPMQRAQWILDGYSASDELRSEVVRLLLANQRIQAEYVIGRIKSRGRSVYEEWVAKGGIRRLELDDAWLGGESARLLQDWRLD